MKATKKTIKVGSHELTFEIGRFAQQAHGAVLASYGDTVVLATVVRSQEPTELDYVPLQVEFAEKLYAGGIIKGSRWVKREGRPSDESILKARLIDRSIRPLFAKSYRFSVQIIITVLSVDKENDPDMVGLAAVSAALAITDIPWKGPVSGVRVGRKDGQFIINPSTSELIDSDLDLIVSGTAERVLMLEAGANQISESDFVTAIKLAQEANGKIIAAINELQKEVGKAKQDFDWHAGEGLIKKIQSQYATEIAKLAVERAQKSERKGLGALVEEIYTVFTEEFGKKEIHAAVDYLIEMKIREDILKEGKRPDGRTADEIRPLAASVGILPRTHGSAIFQRGDTQALTITTLGPLSLEQWFESAEGEESKRYIHHYFMPPYSVGETGRVGWPSRREIGHGALAERALLPVIPDEETFPYTIRVVSEIMSSNGSTSMASTCGSTLSLMDAGVPIKQPVAGISIGLVTDTKAKDGLGKYVLLTDIMGLEDFAGDMDFKVAGTKDGITAIQLDVKIGGLTTEIIEETFVRAKKARLIILEKMAEAIKEPRQNISKHAPKVKIVKVPVEKIGEVIGPGGKMIKKIISETGCDLNMEDDGTLSIAGPDEEKVTQAANWVSGLIREVLVGEVFEQGEVTRLMPFGAFVRILPGKEGLVHVSKMSTQFVKDPEEIVKIGDKVKVKVVEIDESNRINLSMLSDEEAAERHSAGGFNRGSGFNRGGGDRRDFRHDRRHDHRHGSSDRRGVYKHPHLRENQ